MIRVERAAGEGMIRVRGLTKRFGRVTVVEGLDLTVGPGEVFALLGPNGSGKTTTLKAIVGLVRPSAGKISLDGIDLAADRERALSRVSYLPQRPSFADSLSGLEVLRFYARLRRLPGDAVDAAALVAGLDGALGRRVGEYSGGMAQRLALGVLSLPDAPILLLDEPSAGLDPEGTERLREWLAGERARGKAILLTTHILEDAADRADRAGILVKGRLAAVMEGGEVRRRERLQVSLVLESGDPRFAAVAVRAGAEEVRTHGTSISFTAPAERALGAVEALRADGARILRFTTAPQLERLYREVTHGTE